jgi:hypothetical protein
VHDNGIIRTVSTSPSTADVSDVVLRTGDRRRLVFRPMLLRNPNNDAASVRGTLVYQAKRVGEQWVDVTGLNLSTMRTDEWTKVELRSEELLKLYQAVGGLYTYMREHGISYRDQEMALLPIEKGEVVRQVLSLLEGEGSGELVRAFFGWASGQSMATLAASLRGTDADSLITFDAALTVARMRHFISIAKKGLTSSDEGRWQALLKRELGYISELCPTCSAHQGSSVRGRQEPTQHGWQHCRLPLRQQAKWQCNAR